MQADEEKKPEAESPDRLRSGWPLPEGARRVPLKKDEDEDEVDEAADESFPASDPPSFTPGKTG